MANKRSVRSMLVSAGLALVALAGVGMAQARDVNWSLGISSPGVVVDMDNGRGVRVLPAPVYLAPPPPPPPRAVYYPAPAQPVYYAPPPPRPVYYAPPVYVAPPPGYYYRDEPRHHRHRHHDRGHGRGYGDHGYDDRRSGWERR